MKTPGDYALLHANGTSFREIVNMIRVEAMEWYAAHQEAEQQRACPPPCTTCWQCPNCFGNHCGGST